jgi:phospholipid/cholesterol/gamma-HCH transport system ATP-binding protein
MIELIDLKKRFGDRWITNGVTLSIPPEKTTCIIGRSGEGKSVLLKQMIGLIKPTSGHILIDGKDITTLKTREKEDIYKKCGYVFQFAALLDSLNIFENVGLTLLEHGMPIHEVLPIVKEKLALVNLGEDVLYKYPCDLSGGMRKRVGIARTLITNPSIIFYDEPTTGLDPITSRLVYELIADTQKRFKVTSIIISHDVEVFKYVDYVALLQDGKIQYCGDAKTIWDCDNPYVYQFIRGLLTGPIQPDVTIRKQQRRFKKQF